MFNAEKGLVLSITGSENWLKATAFITASLSYDVLHSDCTISDFKTFRNLASLRKACRLAKMACFLFLKIDGEMQKPPPGLLAS